MKSPTTKLYEIYHAKRILQKKVITARDFTYTTVISLLSKYGFKGKDILDIGCGTGTMDFYIAKNGGWVKGLDISKNAIKIAKKNAVLLNLSQQVNFSNIDFPKQVPIGRYDMILCMEVLEHLKNDYLAVKKIKKLLNDDGIVIASSPSVNSPLYKLGKLKKFDKEVGHLRRYTQKSFEDLFLSNKMTIVESKLTEGFLRNFLFTSKIGGFVLKFAKRWPFSKMVTFVDNITVQLFGESDIVVVAKK